MRQVLPGLLVSFLIGVPSPSVLAAANAASPTSATPPTKQIEITMRASRLQVVTGTGFGIWADIKNISSKPVFLNPKLFAMTPPSEVSRGDNFQDWAAVIPGSFLMVDRHDYFNRIIKLEAQSSTTAFWSGPGYATADAGWAHWESFKVWLTLVYFVPGEYTFKVVGAYWSELEPAVQAFRRLAMLSAERREKDTKPEAEENDKATSAMATAKRAAVNKDKGTGAEPTGYRSEIAEIKIAVTAPQSIILVGAAIGGLIAYFLLPNVRLTPHRITVPGMVTAALLSTIVTILISRISEAQFPVKITVTDFWGAMTMGFIACAWGTTILKKYTGQTKEDDVKGKASAAAAGVGASALSASTPPTTTVTATTPQPALLSRLLSKVAGRRSGKRARTNAADRTDIPPL